MPENTSNLMGGVFARFAYHAGPDKERKMLTDEIQKLYALYLNATQSPKEFAEEDAMKIAEIARRYGVTADISKPYGT